MRTSFLQRVQKAYLSAPTSQSCAPDFFSLATATTSSLVRGIAQSTTSCAVFSFTIERAEYNFEYPACFRRRGATLPSRTKTRYTGVSMDAFETFMLALFRK